MQTFIGVKLIQASPGQKDGKDGYNVIYQDGYASWSPKEVFESAYLPLAQENTLVQRDIDIIIAGALAQQLDPKTTLVKTECITGFCLYETSSCVDPVNYNEKIGAEMAMSKINNKVWFALGFVLQWAKYGLKHTAKIGGDNHADSQ